MKCTSEDFPSARSASRENHERGAQGEALCAHVRDKTLSRCPRSSVGRALVL